MRLRNLKLFLLLLSLIAPTFVIAQTPELKDGIVTSQIFVCASTADITNTASTQITGAGCAAAGANIRHHVSLLGASNMSATATRVDFLDGSTIIGHCALGQNGNCELSFPLPYPGTAATAINCQNSVNSSATRCFAVGYDSNQ